MRKFRGRNMKKICSAVYAVCTEIFLVACGITAASDPGKAVAESGFTVSIQNDAGSDAGIPEAAPCGEGEPDPGLTDSSWCGSDPTESEALGTENAESVRENSSLILSKRSDVPENLATGGENDTDSADSDSDGSGSEASPEWLRTIPEARDEHTRQLFVVSCDGLQKTTAVVTMHEKNADGAWKQILAAPAYVGWNGVCEDAEHWEGCGQTPMGTYHFNKAFGIAEDPGCAIPYVKVDNDTYWSGDMRAGMHYNEMVDIKDFPDLDLTFSEHIVDASYGYRYCLNISFNEAGTPGRGSAIFLHCAVPGKMFTGGCVAVSEEMMKEIMQLVRPDCVVVIDTREDLESGG